jgi:hypothetical protein
MHCIYFIGSTPPFISNDWNIAMTVCSFIDVVSVSTDSRPTIVFIRFSIDIDYSFGRNLLLQKPHTIHLKAVTREYCSLQSFVEEH